MEDKNEKKCKLILTFFLIITITPESVQASEVKLLQNNSNETVFTAKNLKFGEYEKIDYTRNNYWVKFTVPTNGYITITTDKPINEDRIGTIYFILKDIQSQDTSKQESNVNLQNKNIFGIEAGTYYLCITGAYGTYPSYRYKVDFIAKNNFETENNNSSSSADTLLLNQTMNGSRYDLSDNDYFKLYLDESTKVRVSINTPSWSLWMTSPSNSSTRIEGWTETEDKKYYKDIILPSGIWYIKPSYGEGNYTFTIADINKNGWIKSNNYWYYYKNSIPLKNKWIYDSKNWYHLDEYGIMKTAWQYINNYWYFFDNLGKMQTGWKYINNSWYFLNNSGEMQTGWKYINNYWYFFSDSGKMQSGWKYINNSWYLLNNSGKMNTGWKYINNYWYFFSDSGKMHTGWKYINNSWYFLNTSGKMATSMWKDGWYIDTNGIAHQYKY